MLKRLQHIGKSSLLLFISLCISIASFAQCSICTRTAQQLGEGPAKDLNAGIIYLAFTPLIIIGFLSYRWIKSQKE